MMIVRRCYKDNDRGDRRAAHDASQVEAVPARPVQRWVVPHGRSLFAEFDDVRITESGPDIFDFPQRPRRDVPSLPLLGDDGNRLPVISGKHTQKRFPSLALEQDPVTDRELKHSGMGTCLVQEAQPFDDPIVQVDQFCFGEAVYIDLRSHNNPQRSRTGRQPIGLWRHRRHNVRVHRTKRARERPVCAGLVRRRVGPLNLRYVSMR